MLSILKDIRRITELNIYLPRTFNVMNLSGEQHVIANRGRQMSAKRRRLMAKLCSRIVMKIGARITSVIVDVAYSTQCLDFDISIRSSLHSQSF